MLTKKHVEFFSPEEASDRNRGFLSWGLCPCGLLRTVQSEWQCVATDKSSRQFL